MDKLDIVSQEVRTMLCDLIHQIEHEYGQEYKNELNENYKLSKLWLKSQEENKILRENAEHNDKVVDDVNWKNRLLKQENQQLKEVIEEVRKYTNDKLFDDYTYCSYEDVKQNINEILDKVEEN